MTGNNAATRLLKISIPLVAGVLLLSSCITVNERLSINTDGSGTVQLSYQIARIALDLPSSGSVRTIPLPASPNDFASAVRKVKGLTLTSFTPEETPAGVGATAGIAFTGVADLSQVLGASSGMGFNLVQNGGSTLFRQTIYPGNPKGVSVETLALVKNLFGTERLVFSLRAPAAIQSTNLGTLSRDGRTASYTTTVPDIIQARRPVVWEVRW